MTEIRDEIRDSHRNSELSDVRHPSATLTSYVTPTASRDPKLSASHHTTRKNRRDVFFSDRDRELYLNLLKEYSQQ